MKENINMNIAPEELKSILLNYYKKLYNNEDIQVLFNAKQEYVPHYEDKQLFTIVNVERKIKVGNHVATITYELDESDIRKVLNEDLEKTEYEIFSLSLNTKLETCHSRSFYDEYVYQTPTFKGVNTSLKRKERTKQKIKE